jgi:hypothetical protein
VMISTRSVGLVIDTVVCLTLDKWETVSGQFGGYLSPHARRHFGGKAAELAWRSSKGRDSGSQPDALGVATRLVRRTFAGGGSPSSPPLKSAGDRRRPRLPINDGELARDLPGPENGPESSR